MKIIARMRTRYQITAKRSPEFPILKLPRGDWANRDTAQIVNEGKGQASIANIRPRGIHIIPAIVAIPPVIIKSGCAGSITGFAIKEVSESCWKYAADKGRVINWAAIV
jgi:hypothetical protein